ncbi:DHS-like NAD/FAD-binding domain-containing protein [Tuber indicum]|nr:DHS-like NAD/FAD-binding domain-containing protein [Tuber indicum]
MRALTFSVALWDAAISTSASISDFRTPGTGLYSNLPTLNLPHPETVFDINFFRTNPQSFYTLSKSALTCFHKRFTHYIDALERAARVPPEKLVEAIGSFAGQLCIKCHAECPADRIEKHPLARSDPRCETCTGLVKPNIVFLGESLSRESHMRLRMVEEADLVIIMGSSLSVYPFAALPAQAREGAVRVLINNERAGAIGGRADDALLLGRCDWGWGGRRALEEV